MLTPALAAYRRARAEWLAAIDAGRPHSTVNALWEVVRLAAARVKSRRLVPGEEV